MVTYPLPIVRDYCASWTVVDAIREVIQNALDSESPFEWEHIIHPSSNPTMHSLTFHSCKTILHARTLLLGSTTKKEGDTIGAFGEGYKIALLVLTRNNIFCAIRNGGKLWTPRFRYSNKYEQDILAVEETPLDIPNKGLSFTIDGLSNESVDLVFESCLQMQADYGERLVVEQGEILYDRPGKLYVGGLFISNTELKFGYNIKPDHITLERDRKTVDSWNLKGTVRDMWYGTKQWDVIAELIFDRVSDLSHAEYYAPKEVDDACFKHFHARNPNKIIVRSEEDAEVITSRGSSAYVANSGAYYSSVSNSSGYRSHKSTIYKEPSPSEVLNTWLSTWEPRMDNETVRAFQRLIDTARDWRLINRV